MTTRAEGTCAECRRSIAQRPGGGWQHAIPRPADPWSTIGDTVAAREYGIELGLWSLRTADHAAVADMEEVS